MAVSILVEHLDHTATDRSPPDQSNPNIVFIMTSICLKLETGNCELVS